LQRSIKTEAGVRKDERAVSLDKCFRATVRMYVLFVGPPGSPSVPQLREGAFRARRRNFSIRFPSRTLINCGQLLKRQNEGTAMHLSRAFLIGSRVRCIFVYRRDSTIFFFISGMFCKLFSRRDNLTFRLMDLCYNYNLLLSFRNLHKNIYLRTS